MTIAEGIRTRRAGKRAGRRYTKGIFGPAIEELKVSLNTVTTNEPLNRKRGDIAQAELEKRNAKSFKAAIAFLGRK